MKALDLPNVIGHRGASGYAPENTKASFRKAKEFGATWVEFDAKLSKDGQAIVFHDDDLRRTTAHSGKVDDYDYHYLSKLDAGSWFSPRFHQETISSLESIVGLLGELHLFANIEIKPCPGTAEETTTTILATIQSCWPESLPFPLISSFDWSCLELIRAMHPDFNLGLLMHEWHPDWLEKAKGLESASIHVYHRILTPARIEMLLAENFHILAYTVNDPVRAKYLLSMGVDAVFSDYPDLLSMV